MNTNSAVPVVPNLPHAENVTPQAVAVESPPDQENIDNQNQMTAEPPLVMPNTEAVMVPAEDIAVEPDNNAVPETATVLVEPNLVSQESVPSVAPILSSPSQTQKLDPDAIKKIIGEMVDKSPDSLDLTGLAALAKQVGEANSIELGE